MGYNELFKEAKMKFYHGKSSDVFNMTYIKEFDFV